MAERLGGGAKAFSRYENGKTRPSLVKLLGRSPDLLDEVRAAYSLGQFSNVNRSVHSPSALLLARALWADWLTR